MNCTKRIFLAFLLFFSFQFLFSQDISQASESIKKIAKIGADRWQSALVLTNKQKEKLATLITAYEMKKANIFKSEEIPVEEKNQHLLDLEENQHQNIEKLLTEQQIAKFRSKLKPIQKS